jgi:repressor LexA
MPKLNQEYFDVLKKYIETFYTEYDKAPTIREIESGTKIPRATAQRYLEKMRDNGEIEYSGFRGVSTPTMQKLRQENSSLIGLVGTVACGEPIFAEENISDYFRLPTSIVGSGNFFLLKAKGDSMIDAGIDDGDLILIRQQNYADKGQIVVALIEDEATLKRYYPEPENRRIRLHPENKSLDDIFVEDIIIQGVAIKALKDLT